MQEALVEHVISDLVTRFERGRMTRRELIQSLALVAAAGTTQVPPRSSPAASITCRSSSTTCSAQCPMLNERRLVLGHWTLSIDPSCSAGFVCVHVQRADAAR